MISVSTAIKIVDRETRPLAAEKVSIDESLGRVLQEDIVADSDLPPFDRSQMDGFAVRAIDTANAPIELTIIGEAAAGRSFRMRVGKGEAVRIMTGAPVPAGADSVQKVELTRENAPRVTILEPTVKGRFIIQQGQEIKKGRTVIKKGELVSERNIAVLAAFGYHRVRVSRRPRVAIFSTGQEIVEIGKKPGRDQIRNSNSIMLKALCDKHGANVTVFPTAGDDISDLKSQISHSVAENDILVTTGGVSVGKYDLTKRALAELGAEIFFERVRLKPGKPTVFAKLGRTIIFALPGNPVSAAVTYYLFVRRTILGLQNALAIDLPFRTAVLARPVSGTRERECYLPATLAADTTGHLSATALRSQGSSDFVGFARAEALIVMPRGKSYNEGDIARILLI